MSVTTTAAPQAPQSIGAIGRIIGAIANPRPTFEDIARKPTWLAPLLVLIIVSLATTAVLGQRIGWRNLIEKQIAQSASAQRRIEQLSPEQREQAISTQAKFAPYGGYIFSFLLFTIPTLVFAAVLLGVFNAISSAELNFKTSFGIATHAFMPFAIVSLLGILILYIKPPDQIDLQNVVASNVGAFVPGDASKWLQSLGASLDLFSFWMLGLMGFGYSVARPKKISMGSGVTWAAIIWAVYVLLKVGAAAMFS